MALIAPVAGAYTAVWNSLALGLAEEGYRLIFSGKEQRIEKSDQWGDSLIDSIYRGMNCQIAFTMLEYGAAGAASAMWPVAALGAIGTIGRSAVTSLCKVMVLTSTAGTPAAASPATLTANLVKLSPNANPEIIFDSRLRQIPILMDIYPNTPSSTTLFFTTT